MKTKLIVFLAAAACFAGAFAASNADYVQDGLVTHFDAIDNAGTGAHVANATQWKDLKGSATITLKSGATWSDKYLLTTTERHSISGMPAYERDSVTAEASVDVVETGMSDTKKWPRIFADGQKFSIHYSNGRKDLCLFMQKNDVAGAADGRVYSGSTSLWTSGTVVAFSGSDSFGIAIDGRVVASATTHSGIALSRPASADWSLNGYEGPLKGRYYGFRVYSRKLNAEELLQNAIVDKIRYRNTSPSGYRDGGDHVQRRVFVANTAGGVVKVDGATLTADYEVWPTIGTAATYTLTATAQPGYTFQRWTGDTDFITSGNFYSNTITVARSLAMSFTPVFTAIPEPAMAAPVITINVASGTKTMSAWLSENSGVTIGSSGTIVKTGAGTLQVTDDSISSFAGEIVIEAGRWRADTRTGLGTKNGGAVWVNNGATLHMFHGQSHGWASGDQITRKAYIIGTGTDGKGAIYGSSGLGGNSSEVYGIYPKYITLLGDARIESADHVNFDHLYVDMNRHTITVSPKDSDWIRLSGTWTNGNINVVTKPILIETSDPVLCGGAENVIRFKTNSGYRANDYAATANNGQAKWTAVFENSSILYGPNKSGKTAGWNGPVILEGDTAITCQDTHGKIAFWGPVSGAGNFGKKTTAVKYVNLKLANANNSFTGGIYLRYNSFESTVDGAIPANGGALDSTNSTVYLSAATSYHLPDLVISGTGSVYSVANTTGSFKNATKIGSDTITWNTKVGAKSFALNGGKLKFGSLAADADFGRFSAARGTTLDLSGNAWTCTNLTGAATLVDGALTVNGPWTLDAANANTFGGGTATVTFGPNASLTLTNVSGLSRSQVYTIATTAATYSEPLALDAGSMAAHWRVRVSSDNKSLELFNASGLTIIFR